MARLAHASHRLGPAEGFLDPLADTQAEKRSAKALFTRPRIIGSGWSGRTRFSRSTSLTKEPGAASLPRIARSTTCGNNS
jgi:hypothetical protein